MFAALIELYNTLMSVVFIMFAYLKYEINYIISYFCGNGFSCIKFISFRIISLYLDSLVYFTGTLLFTSKKGKIPAVTNRLLLQSACQLSAKIRKRELKAEDLVKEYINRINAVNPHINAVIDERFTAAVIDAIEIDKRVQHEVSGNGPLNGVSIYNQPLLGIPFSCKDSIAIEDLNLTGGLKTRKGIKAKDDATVIKLLREAGAIPIVLTNVPEIIMWVNAQNKLYGRTNNPHDLSRVPGGSSGGEGALISSAGSLIGVGSDIGGSIRIPSFCCGIFGHKTTPGIVSTDKQFPVITPEKNLFSSVGPMTRYAEDLRPMLKVMCGPNINKLKLDENVDLSKMKIYYMFDDNNPFNTRVTNEIRELISKVTSHMKQKYGSQTREVIIEKFSYGFLIWAYSLMDANVQSLESELSQGKGMNLYVELIKCFLGLSHHTHTLILFALIMKLLPNVKSKFGQKYVRMGIEFKKEFKQILGNDGIFIFPTHPEPALKHPFSIFKLRNTSYTSIMNTLGVPSTHCPLGLNNDGLPIGVQIVAAPYNDHLTIAMANELELAFGGWKSPSKIIC